MKPVYVYIVKGPISGVIYKIFSKLAHAEAYKKSCDNANMIIDQWTVS